MDVSSPTRSRWRMIVCLALAIGTLVLYWPVGQHEFINVEDYRFVTQNAHVLPGLTWAGVKWAMGTFYAETWQPLTWISHMLDCQLFGLNSGAHHLTNVLIHIANTLLLFLWLEKLTGATGRSAMVAALFAWHPLHVEVAAWVYERKEELSTLFGLLALMGYHGYVKKRGALSYLLVLLCYACGLMSKPMLVTLPCVLLLLDWWPLNRFQPGAPGWVRTGAVLFAEKIPFFLLGLAMTMATIYAERDILSGLGGLPFSNRVGNALVSYQTYLTETFWPAKLAFFYPYNFDIPPMAVAAAALLLVVWTGIFLLRARAQPYLLVGWFWFLGTLAPTIGLIQYATQSRADRYMYIPSIGLFITLVWGAYDLLSRSRVGQKWMPALGCLVLGGCLGATSVQLSYWRDSVTLARHALDVTANNYVAYESLGRGLYERGLKAEAITCYRESVRIDPGFPQSRFNLAVALLDAGKPEEAVEQFAAVVKILPQKYELHEELGTLLLSLGDNHLADAASQFAEALRLKPGRADVHNKLGVTLVQLGQMTNALSHFAEAVRLEPMNSEFRFDFGLALLDSHQPAEAAMEFAEQIKLAPGETKGHFRLAQALEKQEKFGEAVAQYHEALRLSPDFSGAREAAAEILKTHPELR